MDYCSGSTCTSIDDVDESYCKIENCGFDDDDSLASSCDPDAIIDEDDFEAYEN